MALIVALFTKFTIQKIRIHPNSQWLVAMAWSGDCQNLVDRVVRSALVVAMNVKSPRWIQIIAVTIFLKGIE